MDLSPLLPAGFLLCSHQLTQNWLITNLLVTDMVDTYLRCRTLSSRVHSFYQRTLADLPMSGKRVKFLVRLRKFFCPSTILAKYLPKPFIMFVNPMLDEYAERTNRSRRLVYRRGLNQERACVRPLVSPLVRLPSYDLFEKHLFLE